MVPSGSNESPPPRKMDKTEAVDSEPKQPPFSILDYILKYFICFCHLQIQINKADPITRVVNTPELVTSSFSNQRIKNRYNLFFSSRSSSSILRITLNFKQIGTFRILTFSRLPDKKICIYMINVITIITYNNTLVYIIC